MNEKNEQSGRVVSMAIEKRAMWKEIKVVEIGNNALTELKSCLAGS